MARAISQPPQPGLLPDGSRLGGWWHSVDDGDRIICDLCPRDCNLKAGDRGFCFVRENRDGQMVLTTYGRSTGFCVDPIEKKPLNHFYPGTSVLSFGTAGCNLGCKFCQNWDISKSREIARLSEQATPQAIATAATRLGCHSVAFTYNDPVIWAEYAIDVAAACRQQGIKTVAVTAGYITADAHGPFFDAIDAANIDLKAFSEQFYQSLTLSHLQPVLDTLRWLHDETDVWCEITNLIIPEANDSEDELRRMSRWLVDHLGDQVPVHFTAFHPDFRMRDRPATPHETLLQAYEIARQEGLKYVYVGNVHDRTRDSTYCHACGALLIERDWHQLGAYRLRDGHCPDCDAVIPGCFDSRPGDWGRRRLPVEISQYATISQYGTGPARSAASHCETVPPPKPAATEFDSRPGGANAALADGLSDSQRDAIHVAASRWIVAATTGRDQTFADPDLAGTAGMNVQGAFVTLKRQRRLRGCCGTMGGNQRLSDAVRYAAFRTATEDPRLPPVSPSELPYLDLDVSLLHDFRTVEAQGRARAEHLDIGRHGIQIHQGDRSGLLLPVVATEHGLNARQFLQQVCRKAGLPDSAWKERDAKLVTFEALAIGGPFAANLFSPDQLQPAPIVSAVDSQRLKEHCQRNLVALLRCATPDYYASGCTDVMIHGASIRVAPVGDQHPPLERSKVSLRPALPMQATLFNLVTELADLCARQQLSPEQIAAADLHLEILYDPAMHGTVAQPDLRGLDTRQRGLFVAENGQSHWRYNPSRNAKTLLEDIVNDAHVASKDRAGVYSLAVVATERCRVSLADAHPENGRIRLPAVAGRFYPADAGQLDSLLDELIGDEIVAAESWPAAMVPHAGLQYSGRIAAAVLRRLILPETIIVIGPNHTGRGRPWAVAPHDVWSLPGATMASDPALARGLAAAINGLELDEQAHQFEHAIEVELPFLARFAPQSRVVGIALGPANLDQCMNFAKGLASVIRAMSRPPLLLISSDMNHFASDAENRRLDELALSALDRCDPESVYRTVRDNKISMCGVLPAVIVLETLRLLGGATTSRRVAYATSGEISGDRDRVVGYAGMLYR